MSDVHLPARPPAEELQAVDLRKTQISRVSQANAACEPRRSGELDQLSRIGKHCSGMHDDQRNVEVGTRQQFSLNRCREADFGKAISRYSPVTRRRWGT